MKECVRNVSASIFRHVDNNYLMTVLAAFVVSKKVELLQRKLALVGPGLFQWCVA